MSAAADKATLRSAMRLRRRALTARQIADATAQLLTKLSPQLPDSSRVASFAGVKGEPELQGALERARPDLTVSYPVANLSTHELQFFIPESPLSPSQPWGIPEPTDGRQMPPSDIDILLVPGVAFGPMGQRLGQGGGFYDRILPELGNQTTTIGVGWRWQLVESLPTEEHDFAVALIVTD